MADIRSKALTGIVINKALVKLRGDFKQQEKIIREGLRLATEAYRAGEEARVVQASAGSKFRADTRLIETKTGIDSSLKSISNKATRSGMLGADKASLILQTTALQSHIDKVISSIKSSGSVGDVLSGIWPN